MVEYAPLELPDDPKLVGNITHFARALRRAGLPIGPGRVLDAIRAVEAVGFTHKRDFYWTLHACFVNRPEHTRIFAQLFRLYWRDPRYMEHMMAAMLPAVRGVQEERPAQAAEKRAAEALLDGAEAPEKDEDAPPKEEETVIEVDASLTMSKSERLKTLDFELMSLAEVAEAKRMLAKLSLPIRPLPSRRNAPSFGRGRIDAARSLRGAMRRGGEMDVLALKQPKPRWPNLVALCDISGSMSQYSRIILHFLHAVANERGAGWAQVHAFTFGTQLTNITRHLRTRDVDAALKAAGAQAQDWEGGTRIGQSIEAFNRDWSRRVLGQGAVVLLITDGLDRDDPDALARQMKRLHLSARRVIWLNPLLRWDGFAPKAAGIRAMLPHVDSFRAGHSIASLEALAAAISKPDDVGEKSRLMAMVGGA
ncbi:vWA domain-containing protein [Sulfitobacter donghicola]|uniref:von Willebrand factor A n=1 Tax=Sulfitobacter donghicola DSW-25 = KCTC 12864 = JCM 14565 TaxID=1300350 RepID=A0A073II66_9RHOB|nr:VWA domain-containing protein [Sulfitobacter donghicola]KEJ89479.1 von Willebrand factor A [Sulfitobacter donghicola DSW-25 = KCTC 12864 = JCM 14565]KIN69302.1 VWA domain protein containing CoxE-like family protein [Sulfitobacter donghicola DSW-25 = KCTC 12864 = JCM 14565]